jgi:hypothetical protein
MMRPGQINAMESACYPDGKVEGISEPRPDVNVRVDRWKIPQFV